MGHCAGLKEKNLEVKIKKRTPKADAVPEKEAMPTQEEVKDQRSWKDKVKEWLGPIGMPAHGF
jgi:hypothetical protein